MLKFPADDPDDDFEDDDFPDEDPDDTQSPPNCTCPPCSKMLSSFQAVYVWRLTLMFGQASSDAYLAHQIGITMSQPTHLPFLPPIGLTIAFERCLLEDGRKLQDAHVESVLWRESFDDDAPDRVLRFLEVVLRPDQIQLDDHTDVERFFDTVETDNWDIDHVAASADALDACPFLRQPDHDFVVEVRERLDMLRKNHTKKPNKDKDH